MKFLNKFRSDKNLNKSPQAKSPRASDVDNNHDHDDAILAFRTITSMLALIQSPTRTTSKPNEPSRDQRRDLRVLDALAAAAVREYEVVAVMKKSSQANLEDSESVADSSWVPIRWLITPNPRPHDRNKKQPKDSLHRLRKPETPIITLVDPDIEISGGQLSSVAPDKLLDTFLLTEWRERPFKFETHLWMLKKLLEQPVGTTRFDTLQLYMIAASFPKMLRRKNNLISKHYINCLTRMKVDTLGFTEPKPSESTQGLDDTIFLRYLPGLRKVTGISNLLARAESKTPCEIYSKETYIEFHNLLCELLVIFFNSLAELQDLQDEVKPKSDVKGVEKKIVDRSAERIRGKLQIVLDVGRSLRAMVTGAAIVKHLKIIAPLLEVNNGMLWKRTDEAEDGDAEFDSLKPYSTYHGKPLLPWQSYNDWLRLLVIYFDAATILHQQVPSVDISVKILASALPSQDMLPWKELLRHKTFFPELSEPGQPSVEDLITFLTSDYAITKDTQNEAVEEGVEEGVGKGVNLEVVIRAVKGFEKKQESAIADHGVDMDGLTENFDKILQQMTQLNDCSSKGSVDCILVNAVIDMIRVLTHPQKTPTDRLDMMRDIVEELEALKSSSVLYWRLKPGQPLHDGNRFSGSVHGEISSASVNDPSCRLRQESQYDEILSEFAGYERTIGVSKRCCPVCARLLNLLKSQDGKPFLTTGGHSTITPCTLPEWLPADIVKQMTVEFGRKLRSELVRLQQRTEVMRQRSFSTETRRISLDSIMPIEEEVDCDRLNQTFERVIK